MQRLPTLNALRCASIHRTRGQLPTQTGLRHRIVFPVRSTFFYDRWLGFLVNGAMSFFAMDPPIFRDRKKLLLNVTRVDELAHLLTRGGMVAGIHPEGTRNRREDPYALLPAQRGVGRLIHQARVPVIPVFGNGLSNSIGKPLTANGSSKSAPVHVIFGQPLEFSEELAQPGSPRVERTINERCVQAIAERGEEERALRAQAG